MTTPRWHRTATGQYHADVERGETIVSLEVKRVYYTDGKRWYQKWVARASTTNRQTDARTLREAKVAAEGLLEDTHALAPESPGE